VISNNQPSCCMHSWWITLISSPTASMAAGLSPRHPDRPRNRASASIQAHRDNATGGKGIAFWLPTAWRWPPHTMCVTTSRVLHCYVHRASRGAWLIRSTDTIKFPVDLMSSGQVDGERRDAPPNLTRLARSDVHGMSLLQRYYSHWRVGPAVVRPTCHRERVPPSTSQESFPPCMMLNS
jgi:hypothetical protein